MDVSKAKLCLEASLSPAPDRTALEWLGELAGLTMPRRASDDGAAITLAAYATRLRAYPADIVRAVLDGWPTQSEFWPTWKELYDLLEVKTKLRRSWLDDLNAIERTLNTPRIAPDPAQQQRQAAAEERERAEVLQGLKGLVVQLADARTTKEAKRSALRARFEDKSA